MIYSKKEAECNNSVQAGIIAEQLFPIGKIIRFRKFRYGLESQTFELITDRGEFALKLYPISKMANVQKEIDIINHLNEYDIPPVLVKNKDGNQYAISDFNILVMLKRIKGIHQNRIKNQKQAIAFGMELGRIHNILRKLSNNKIIPNAKSIDYILEISNQVKKSEFWNENILADTFIKLVASTDWLLFSQRQFTEGIIHSDIAFDNLIFQNNKAYILDYGDAGIGWLLMDLGISILSLAISDKSFSEEISQQILLGYRSVSLLDDKEYNSLGDFIKLACLRKCSAYFDYFQNQNILITKYEIYLKAMNFLPLIEEKVRGWI